MPALIKAKLILSNLEKELSLERIIWGSWEASSEGAGRGQPHSFCPKPGAGQGQPEEFSSLDLTEKPRETGSTLSDCEESSAKKELGPRAAAREAGSLDSWIHRSGEGYLPPQVWQAGEEHTRKACTGILRTGLQDPTGKHASNKAESESAHANIRAS